MTMKIIHVASELAPVAKVGGLADVISGLPRQLIHKNTPTEVIIPKYDCMDLEEIKNLRIIREAMPSYSDGKLQPNRIWEGIVDDIRVTFIEPCNAKPYFSRGCFYGCSDDNHRYLHFCRAVLEYLKTSQKTPDILHLHDWQCAAIAPLYRTFYESSVLRPMRLVFTINNIEHQGKCSTADLDFIGLNGKALLTPEKMADNLHPWEINLMKGGIVFSDYITTVSPKYAEEVLSPSGGRGLESTLLQHKNKFEGVLNGVDYEKWSPASDRFLPAECSAKGATSKDCFKHQLRQRLNLAQTDKPLVATVTRLVPQKGTDLIKHALDRTLARKGQFILLGTSPIPEIEEDFAALKKLYTDHPDVHIELAYNEELAHQIFSGADMFMMPSIFEPCGLTQLIALKYGTIPIVRETGGLVDTIFDIDYSNKPFEKTNGYSFKDPDSAGVDSALDRAITCWYNKKNTWSQIVANSIKMDYSWGRPAVRYLEIYHKLSLSTCV